MQDKIIKIQSIDFQWPMEDPYLFCAHHRDIYPAGNDQQGIDKSVSNRPLGSDFTLKDGYRMYHGQIVPGFPAHPHRGFETVTIALEGLIDHFDSLGAHGRYGNGDVQWLTTGKGCQHAEMFPLIYTDRDNVGELFQVWLNLPSKDKFADPSYKMLWSEDIPVIQEDDGKTQIKIIAGNYKGTQALAPNPASWASDPVNHVGIFLVKLEPGAAVSFPAVSATLNRNLYYYQGTGQLDMEGTAIQPKSRVKLDGNQSITITNGSHPAWFIILEGEPIQEPVAQYGPFVMNTHEEIQAAFNDYRRTEFGGWPWDRSDPVHERDAGRLARYVDGTEERR